MAKYVLKFGGTSVGDLDCIARVADIIQATQAEGHQVAVVVSAMSGETDRLIGLARKLADNPDPREYAVLVSTGEQVAMALLGITLNARGIKAESYTGMQAQILTDDNYYKARIQRLDCSRLKSAMDEGIIPILAGFQGVNLKGEITTLGRGGSDTSAVALAQALAADECRIYTDVEGVFTADPRVVSGARCLERITFEEMLELASLGAKVLQIRAVEFAGKYNVPLRVLSTFAPGHGTLISYEDKKMESPVVSGVAYNRSEAKVTLSRVPDVPGIAHKILSAVSAANVDVDMIIQNVAEAGHTDFTFTVHRDEYQSTLRQLDKLSSEIGAGKVLGDPKIVKLSIVGVGMRSHAGIATTMFLALAQEGINIQLISTSEIKVSVIVDEKYLELGVRALHKAFGLDREPEEQFDPQAS